jgi:heterodisulfide reductase subunit A-like polyferredoxin
MSKYTKRIVIVGSGVAGINAATKLVDNGLPWRINHND